MTTAVVNEPRWISAGFRDREDDPLTASTGVTVTVTDAEGNTLYTDEAATQAAEGWYEWELPAQPAPMLLDAVWTFDDTSGVRTKTTTVDVAGGVYTTPSALRARYPMLESDRDRYPADLLREAVAEFEAMAEAFCHVAFVPRYSSEVRRTGYTRRLPVAHQYPKQPTFCTVDGDTVDVADLTPVDAGFIDRDSYWPSGEVVIGYTHYQTATPPPEIVDACQTWCYDLLTGDQNLINPRATTVTSPDGELVVRLTPAGRYGRTGMNLIDATLDSYRQTRVTAS